MAAAIAAQPLELTSLLAVGTHAGMALPPSVEWHQASHPFPDERSVEAGRRALDCASRVATDECLLILLSGGASALMAVPADGLSLAEKQQTVRTMMLAGADIYALNTVRKHLSKVKGGRLAEACAGLTLTLAVSDVVGDDLSVIGSGPGVPDRSTWRDAADALEQFGGARHLETVRVLARRGLSGDLPDTPKPGDRVAARTHAAVIASQRDALAAASDAARRAGYQVVVLDMPVCGEARDSALGWYAHARDAARSTNQPVCVLSSGETTVRVTGTGRGGRNQEFVLALADTLAGVDREMLVASIGTDGVDGPTDAAGALTDTTTHARAASHGLSPAAFLADNNAYDFFALLGDLIHLGPTDTNVGDVQILLAGPEAR
jgi:glycerate 2-kinase